jgi:3-oxoacyl-[acyl-carrier-protein] synthase II
MRRVVVTGLGVVCPCGNDVATAWPAVVAGRSGIGPITRFDASTLPVRIAGEVRDYSPGPVLHDPREVKRLDAFIQYAMTAAYEAVRDAGLPTDQPLGDRAGVYIGTGIGGIEEITRGALTVQAGGYRTLSPFFIPRSLVNLAAGQVAMRFGARGPSLCISTACATGNHSIGEAWRAIRSGEADLIIAGGTEASIVPLGMAGFVAMKAMSKRNDDPTTACRPFDRDRDGFVMGEGSGIVVLESLDHALARGARIYAEVVGYGNTNDAHHITSPPPGHEGAARCMSLALRSAGMVAEDVDYINAHGTSTPANDGNETQAIRTVFGAHADKLLVSSTKSVTGHLLGAAGGIEAVFTVLALAQGVAPPTATLENADPACDLDYVPRESRAAPLRAALSNAFGFGGTNAVLLFRRLDASEG